MLPREFRAIRNQLGLSAAKLAKELGVASGRTIRRWEAGDRKIPQTVVNLLQRIEAEKKR
jgi:DNA-binding transcriptional regulator YiaG